MLKHLFSCYSVERYILKDTLEKVNSSDEDSLTVCHYPIQKKHIKNAIDSQLLSG